MTKIPQRAATIGTQIYELLRNEIVKTEITPGSVISEAELAAKYQVSRQPIREAFIRLAHENLVEIRPQRGTIVKKIVVDDVLNAQFMREALEVALAREACRKAGTDSVKRLKEILAHQKVASNNEEFLAADDALHREIALIAGREVVWKIVGQFKVQMDRVRYLSYSGTSPTSLLIKQHKSIVDAIALGDEVMAEEAVKSHLTQILDALPSLAKKYPDMFE